MGVHVTDNVGVTLVYIGVYEKGKTDATIDGAFWSLGLVQGDNKNGQYVGEYTFADSVPDGEYDVRYFAKDAYKTSYRWSGNCYLRPYTITNSRLFRC